ncbi:hypothetical protein ACFQ5J_11675 [Lacticaseibacillus baoqingensis]|uniref:LPXTG cell wall anchor domain-containing protein n=1 Tax=Lacticaseibacillus baoqingensis TaxID=2486013 RepID=A0ABW4EBW5_9LACO|nr:hypothetical protein [Lacticaseibacillus baoqingensis]
MQVHKWIRLTLVLVLAGLSLWTRQQVAAATQTTDAAVTFTNRALNPADPRLPLADTSGGGAAATPNKTPSQVVVNTTPEDTKVKTPDTNRQQLPNTNAATTQRTRLPQTGSITLPAALVVLVSVLSIGISLPVVFNRRQLAK